MGQNNISADSAAASSAASTFSKRLEEGDQEKISKTGERRDMQPLGGKCERRHWKRDLEPLKEGEQVAALDKAVEEYVCPIYVSSKTRIRQSLHETQHCHFSVPVT